MKHDTKKCGACGSPALEGARFCPACGAAVPCGEPGAAAAAAGDELRLATILFADVSGFTAMSGRLQPDEVKEIIGDLFGRLAAVIEGERGRVMKYEGDCVMAVFGYDGSVELDPAHACYAALGMRRELVLFSERLLAEKGFALEMRIGIHAGRVAAGLIGGRPDVIGDAVNVAARMEQNAASGKILVTASTAALLKGRFTLEAVSPFRVKGKEEPIAAYNVTGKAVLSPRAILGHNVETIGREAELSGIETAFLNAVRSRSPRAALIEGGAGTGKSRLAHEFLKRLAGPGKDPVVTRCFFTPSSRGEYHVFKMFLMTVAPQCRDESSLARFLGRVMRGAGREKAAAHAGYISSLLGFGGGDDRRAEHRGASPEELAGAAFKAFEDLFAACSSGRPCVVVAEDVHWADGGSLALITHLLKWGRGRLFFVLTSRNDDGPAMPEIPSGAAARFLLGSLPRHLCITMVKRAFGVPAPGNDRVAELLAERIADAAGGNPLFAEELVISLAEAGIVKNENGAAVIACEKPGALAVPATVELAVQARIDSLGRGRARLLRKAAVIGRYFTLEYLRPLLAGDERNDTAGALAELASRGILSERGAGEYSFAHETIRDIAYAGLTRRSRTAMHGTVAAGIERRIEESGSGGGLAEAACFHFEMAGNVEKTFRYATLAGRNSYAGYRIDDAIRFFGLAEKAADAGAFAPDEDALVDFLESYSDAMFIAGRSAELIEKFGGRAAGIRSAEGRARLSLKLIQAYRIFSDDLAAWKKLLDETEKLVLRLGRGASGGRAAAMLGSVLENRAMFHLARAGACPSTFKYLKKALAIRRELGDEKAAMSCIVNLGFVHSIRSEFGEAARYFDEAMRIAKSTEDRRIEAICLINLGVMDQERGNHDLALEKFSAALEICENTGNRRDMAASLSSIGEIRRFRKEYDKAVACCEKALALSREIGHRRGTADCLVEMGRTLAAKGDAAGARKLFAEASELAKAIGYDFCLANCHKGFGALAAAAGERSDALIHYENAISIFAGLGDREEIKKLKKIRDTLDAVPGGPTPKTGGNKATRDRRSGGAPRKR